ncbi:MAG: hypothetical protein WKF83_03045 [Nocardioidaceae bacterium]
MQIDRFARSLLARGARQRPSPRAATAATTSPTSPTAVLLQSPDVFDRPDDEAQEIFRELGVAMMFDEHQEEPARLRRRLRRLLPRERPARVRRGRDAPSTGSASSA